MNIKKSILSRFTIIYLLLAAIGGMIILKIIYLQTFEHAKWAEYAMKLSQKDLVIKALRGDIYSDSNEVLATSVPYYDIYMDPLASGVSDKIYKKNIDTLSLRLATLFHSKSPQEYKQYIDSARAIHKRYLLIKRRINYNQLQVLKQFPIFNRGRYKGGLIIRQTNVRLKPFTYLASRTIGYVSEGPRGNIVGLEGAFDSELKGRDGLKLMRKVAGNQWMEINSENEVEPEDGENIISTINIPLQDVAENTLARQLIKFDAKYGTAILMEVKTGEIKAIANLKRGEDGKYYESYNYAIGESTEPGSTFKLATSIALFEDGFIDLRDTVDTGNGRKKFYDFTISDVKKGGHGKITFKQVFEVSSNVGFATVVDKYYSRRPERFVERLYSLRLNKKLGISIKGEGRPYIKYPGERHWSEISLHQMAIGYELRITPLQILTLYNAVANNGKMVKPFFVKAITKHGKIIKTFKPTVLMSSVCSEETLKKIKIMLEGVVKEGTGRHLQNPNFKIAGKTGTAKIFDQKLKRYVNRYKASFVGYFPADNPRYSCMVMISDPNRLGYYGAVVAGPVFEQIANKVYATNYKITPQLKLKDKYKIASIPYSKSGSMKDLETILEKLNIPLQYYNELHSPWVITERKDKYIECKDRFVHKNTVPNVLGMGVEDALYILEDLGLRVKVLGRGSVTRQSVLPGSKLVKNKLIKLYLGKTKDVVESKNQEKDSASA